LSFVRRNLISLLPVEAAAAAAAAAASAVLSLLQQCSYPRVFSRNSRYKTELSEKQVKKCYNGILTF